MERKRKIIFGNPANEALVSLASAGLTGLDWMRAADFFASGRADLGFATIFVSLILAIPSVVFGGLSVRDFLKRRART